MRFDDRLSTVLANPAASDAIARIQYRQLLDLLGAGAAGAGPQADAAYLRLGELSERLPGAARTATLEDTALRLRDPRLVAQLAASEPDVAAAALGAARLSEEQWLDLIPALSPHARSLIRDRDDLGPAVGALLRRLGVGAHGLPSPAEESAKAPPPAPAPTPAEPPIEGIGAIVRRIEQFRKTRREQEDEAALGEAPRLPLDDDAHLHPRRLASFDFATDAEGRIVWSDPASAPMAIGLRLATADIHSPARASRALVTAFRRRQPVRGEPLHIAGAPAIAGEWQADAAPRFERPTGRFVGYWGRMRRPADPAALPPAPPAEAETENDRMRQILHELRTPVNAIQGFSEVIQQQLFGPTSHEYRALAATIASDAARMLAGFEELDRLVRLDSGALDIDPGECDVATILTTTIAQLEPYTARRGSGFALDAPDDAPRVAMAGSEAERLVWRLLATLASAAGPGETLRLKLRPARDDMVRIVLRLPASLAERDDESLFHAVAAPQPHALSTGAFGIGFALRLAAAEARAAGGSLERKDSRLRLSLPLAASVAQIPANEAIP